MIQRADQLEIIKHHEKFILESGVKKNRSFFYVKHSSGQFGYVMADELGFIQTEHADLLLEYYTQAPLSKSDWKSEERFLHIVPMTQSSMSKQ